MVFGVVGITLLIAIFSGMIILNREVLPPTTMDGHLETVPDSHILDKQMPLTMQKHMLEHADATEGGPGGVIINYNCENFDCEEDLIQKLTDVANEYPEFVYLTPFDGMTVKIAITSLGKIEVFDELDEAALVKFIERT